MAGPAPRTPSDNGVPTGSAAVTTDPTTPDTSGSPKASGGGCSVGNGGGANALWLVGLGLAAVFRRRRRTR
jgi:MYXO-CTERM domain-containing protein